VELGPAKCRGKPTPGTAPRWGALLCGASGAGPPCKTRALGRRLDASRCGLAKDASAGAKGRPQSLLACCARETACDVCRAATDDTNNPAPLAQRRHAAAPGRLLRDERQVSPGDASIGTAPILLRRRRHAVEHGGGSATPTPGRPAPGRTNAAPTRSAFEAPRSGFDASGRERDWDSLSRRRYCQDAEQLCDGHALWAPFLLTMHGLGRTCARQEPPAATPAALLFARTVLSFNWPCPASHTFSSPSTTLTPPFPSHAAVGLLHGAPELSVHSAYPQHQR
jgi:hypothetical protein